MKNVMIRYTLLDAVATGDVEAAISTFVAALGAHGGGVQYTSYRLEDIDRSYVHIGSFPDQATLEDIQKKPFFGEFAGFLRDKCAEGPSVSWLAAVASTHIGR